MGLLRFFKRLNCFGYRQRKSKSKREMETEMGTMRTKIEELQERISTTRKTIQDINQQKQAEENYAKAEKRRNDLMDRVQRIEMELQSKLRHRQMVLTGVVECSIPKMERQIKLETIKKTATSFVKKLEQDKQNTKEWRENLRRVRSQNDLHKAVPQPPLVLASVRC